MKTSIDFTRVNNDTNGNPRYVCHFLSLIGSNECEGFSITEKYNFALNRAKQIGGRKFHNKQFGGGIVFQSYNITDTDREINELLPKENEFVTLENEQRAYDDTLAERNYLENR